MLMEVAPPRRFTNFELRLKIVKFDGDWTVVVSLNCCSLIVSIVFFPFYCLIFLLLPEEVLLNTDENCLSFSSFFFSSYCMNSANKVRKLSILDLQICLPLGQYFGPQIQIWKSPQWRHIYLTHWNLAWPNQNCPAGGSWACWRFVPFSPYIASFI